MKDPAIAALLAWLVPGLGHVYQRRTAKGILFFVCLVGTFAYGCYLGGRSDLGWARVVYAAWNGDDTRLPYLCQLGIGLPAMPALLQANRTKKGLEPWWGGFMAPPRPEDGNGGEGLAKQPTLSELNFKLHSYFELGTVYTMIAGLLNILAILDAWGGPVFPEEAKKDEEEEGEGEEEEDKKEAADPQSTRK